MTPQEFLDALLPGAQAAQRQYGIPASFTLAEAILESSWGKKAAGNNLFGVKADSAWHGPTVDVPTHEVIKGQRIAMTCKFRAYANWAECLADHAAFLKSNPRYASAFHEKTGEGFARAVAAAHYATDPDYAQELIDVMNGRNLQRFDQVQVTA